MQSIGPQKGKFIASLRESFLGIVPEVILLLLSQESFDRNCCGGLEIAMLDCSLGNNDDQSLQRAVLCQQSGV